MFPSGGIAPLAQQQLAAWEAIARYWPTVDDGSHERCGNCGQSIRALADNCGRPYQYIPEQRLALTVAHLRQAHAELDPDAGP
jgi:hypothetical protein